MITQAQAENFIEVWQSSSSAKQASERLKIPYRDCRQIAYTIRVRWGIPIKRFTIKERIDFGRLKEIAEAALQKYLTLREQGGAA